jgi:hypothetical protein
MDVVADVGALHPEDDIFGDVGSVVSDALQIAGDEQGVKRLAHDVWALVHRLDQLYKSIIAHAIDDIVHLEDGLCEFNFSLNEGLQGAPNHRTDRSSHACNVNRQIGRRKIDHIHDALGDVDGLIADALQIGIDLGDRQDKAEIDRHWLLHGQEVEGFFVDLAFRGIDLALAFQHHLAPSEIAFDIGLTSAVDGLLRQSSHAKQPLPQIVEPLLKTRTHRYEPFYPNLPVM